MIEERRTLRRAVSIGLVLTVLTAAYFLHLDLTADPDVQRKQTDRFPLPVQWTIFASICFGMGVGTQIALLWSNWHRMGSLLHPTKARVMGSIAMVLVLPVWQGWGIPALGGLFWYGLFNQLFSGGDFFPWMKEHAIFVFLVFLLMPVLVYIVTCLTIGGVRRKFLKLAVLGQVWLALYGAALLMRGLYTGNV